MARGDVGGLCGLKKDCELREIIVVVNNVVQISAGLQPEIADWNNVHVLRTLHTAREGFSFVVNDELHIGPLRVVLDPRDILIVSGQNHVYMSFCTSTATR